jgi:GTP-dependent phosphoenolpyruvate carboxykinase
LIEVDMQNWTGEIEGMRKFLAQFASHLPDEMLKECDALSKHVP